MILKSPPYDVTAKAGRIGRIMPICFQAPRVRVVAVKTTAVGPEPEQSRAILRNVDDHGFCSDPDRYARELPGLAIKPIHAVIISQPERASRIRQNRVDEIHAQAVWVIRLVLKDLERRQLERGFRQRDSGGF